MGRRWLLQVAVCSQLPAALVAAPGSNGATSGTRGISATVAATVAASAGTGGGPAASGTAAAASSSLASLHAAYQAQRARCLALPVAAVRAECLRQAERDLAHGLAALKATGSAGAAAPASATHKP